MENKQTKNTEIHIILRRGRGKQGCVCVCTINFTLCDDVTDDPVESRIYCINPW